MRVGCVSRLILHLMNCFGVIAIKAFNWKLYVSACGMRFSS